MSSTSDFGRQAPHSCLLQNPGRAKLFVNELERRDVSDGIAWNRNVLHYESHFVCRELNSFVSLADAHRHLSSLGGSILLTS